MPTKVFIVAALATTLFAAACSAPEKTRWNKSGGGGGPKPSDLAACRADAERRAEREFGLDTDPRGDREFGASGGLSTELARRDANRYRQRIYDQCLRSLGYERAPSSR